MESIAIDPQFVAIVPVLIGLLAALKQAGFNSRYIPILAIAAGLIIGGFLTYWNPMQTLIIGGGLGLSSIGAHSGVKNTLKK
jgi:asparagine N-glycosylation enzyme membrane subunit Stt3